MAKINDFTLGDGFLAKAYGRKVVGGHLVEHKIDGNQVYIHVLMGVGEWDAIEQLTYDGEILDPSNYNFYPGVAFPTAIDPWFPTSLKHHRIARYTAQLPTEFSIDDRPDKMKAIVRTSKVSVYDEDGVEVDYLYSLNPADHFVDLVKQNCDRLGLNIVDFIDWDAYLTARAFYGETLSQANYNLAPKNFNAIGSTLSGSIPSGSYTVSMQARDGGLGRSLRAGEIVINLASSGNISVTATPIPTGGPYVYGVFIRNSVGAWHYQENGTPNFTISSLVASGVPPAPAGVFLLNLARFESHVDFPSPTSLNEALSKLMLTCCSDWQKIGRKYRILLPNDRAVVHSFDESNTMPGSFSDDRIPRKKRINRVIINYRDTTMDVNGIGIPQIVNREETQSRIGAKEESIDLDGMSPNQAFRVANFRIRQLHDLPVSCELTDDGTAAHALPGDVVEVSDNGKEWVNKQFVVLKKQLEDSDSSRNSKFVLGEYDPDIYSDDDSAPLQSTTSSPGTAFPNPGLPGAPPAIVDLDLVQDNNVAGDGGISLGVIGTVEFGTFGSGQTGLLFHQKPSGSYQHIQTLTPNPTDNTAGFRVENLIVGTHNFKVIVVNSIGVQQSDAVDEFPILIVAFADAPPPPENLEATFTGQVIRWSWDAADSPIVSQYIVKDGSGVFIAQVGSLFWDEQPTNGTHTRRVFSVDKYGNESSTFVEETFEFDIATQPLSPTNYVLKLEKRELVHSWDSTNLNGRYQVTKDILSGYGMNYGEDYGQAANFSSLIYEGFNTQFRESLVALTSRSVSRFVRAVNEFDFPSPSVTETESFPAPIPVVISKDAIKQFPNSLVLHIGSGNPKAKVLFTIAQVRQLPDGVFPSNTSVEVDGNYRWEGSPDQITVTSQAGGDVEIRISQEDIFTQFLNDNQWSHITHTFPQIQGGDIADGVVQDTHIASLRANKVTAQVGDFQIVFADNVGSRNYISAGADDEGYEESIEFGTAFNAEYDSRFNSITRDFTGLADQGGFRGSRFFHTGDGYVEFTIDFGVESNDRIALALTSTSTSPAAEFNEALFLVEIRSQVYTGGLQQFKVYESGSNTFTGGVWEQGDRIKISIDEGDFKLFKNDVLIFTGGESEMYPLAFDAFLMEQGMSVELGAFSLFGRMESAPGKPHWKNQSGVTLDANDNPIKLETGDWGTGGCISAEFVEGDGFVEWNFIDIDETPTDVAFAVGLSHEDIDQNYTSILWGILCGTADELGESSQGFIVVESGVEKFQFLSASLGASDKLRIAVEDLTVVYRLNGEIVYTSLIDPQDPRWYADVSIRNQGNFVPNVRIGEAGAAPRGWMCNPDGLAEFSRGVIIGGSNIDAVRARSINAISESNRYRGNDFGTPLENRINASMFSLGNVRTFETDVYDEINVDIPDEVLEDTYANYDSVRFARLRLYTIFGDKVQEMEQSFNGRGKIILGVHSRDFCDPLDEAVYSIEFKNFYGWSRPIYFTFATTLWEFDGSIGRNWTGNGTINPPEWLPRSDYPSNLRLAYSQGSTISLTWTPPVTNTFGGTNYRVYQRNLFQGPKGIGRGPFVAIGSVYPQATNSTSINLGNSLEFEFVVTGGGGGAMGGATDNLQRSNTAYVKLFGAVPGVLSTHQPPIAVSAAPLNSTQVVLKWVGGSVFTSNTNTEVTINGGASWVSAGDTTETWTFGTLDPNTDYLAGVRLVYAGGTSEGVFFPVKTLSAGSGVPEINPSNPTLPTANDPSNLRLSIVGLGNAVNLTWNKNGGSNARVERSLNNGGSWQVIASGLGSAETYTDIPGFARQVWYAVFNETGGSNFSNVANIWTQPNVIPDPEGGSGCITLDTLVLLTNGVETYYKVAKDVQVGDILVSVNNQGGLTRSRVKRLIPGFTTQLYVIHTKNNSLWCSPSHPIIQKHSASKGTPAKDLRVGDSVLVDEGLVVLDRITAIEVLEVPDKHPVIIYELEGEHTFISGGLVSHNLKPQSFSQA
jgi:hypothetical protein